MKISDTVYDFLNVRKDIHWYCDKCEPKVLSRIQVDKGISVGMTVGPSPTESVPDDTDIEAHLAEASLEMTGDEAVCLVYSVRKMLILLTDQGRKTHQQRVWLG